MAVDPTIVWKGPDELRSQLVPIDELHEDPANVNQHPPRSIEAIAASYARFGQQRSILADGSGVVRAGNGQLAAARRLGWTHMAVVRSDLRGAELTAYSIADNRISEFSSFDTEVLTATLRALQAEDFPIADVGFTDAELEELLDGLGAARDVPGEAPAEETVPERWMVVIECRDEAHQVELLGRFQAEGLGCRAIVS
jgi:ParB-like chromosome segregation protein Spo0J